MTYTVSISFYNLTSVIMIIAKCELSHNLLQKCPVLSVLKIKVCSGVLKSDLHRAHVYSWAEAITECGRIQPVFSNFL